MKKVLTTLALAASLATSASAYSYSTPGVSTGSGFNPWDMQPTFSIEALYGIANNSEDPDMAGARLGFSMISDAAADTRHQFGVYVAPMWGDTDYQGVELDAQLIPVTLGYDIYLAMSDKVLLDFGLKAGYAFGELDVKVPNVYSESYSADGFTFSIGAAIKVLLSDQIHMKVGYEFSRSYLDAGGDVGSYNYGAHVISLGVGCSF